MFNFLGKSTPAACLEDNTTWDLVSDIEKLRTHLSIDSWLVFGGSWGSTLALTYSLKHPERVDFLVLRGIFTLRRKELLWFYQEGASFLFPDYHNEFKKVIPVNEQHDLISAFYRKVTGPNKDESVKAAKAWSIYEMATSRLFVDPEYIKRAADDEKFSIQFASIETHYFVHGI